MKEVIKLGSIRIDFVEDKQHKAFRKLCIDEGVNMQVKLKQMIADELRKHQRTKKT